MDFKYKAKVCLVLFSAFFFLVSLPGIADVKNASIPDPYEGICGGGGAFPADATRVEVTPVADATYLASLMDGSVPINEAGLSMEEESFINGFIEGIKERYPFAEDAEEAFINIGKDALLVVVGAGITIVLTGIIASLSAAGAAATGTIIVGVLIAGAAIGIIFSVGSIVRDYIKEEKRLAGKKSFNLLRELLFITAGAKAGTTVSPYVSKEAVKVVRYLEKRSPSFFQWLLNTVEPTCLKIKLWFGDLPYKIKLLRKEEKPSAITVFIEKGGFQRFDVTNIYRNVSDDILRWSLSENQEAVNIRINSDPVVKMTVEEANRRISDGAFKLAESEIVLKNAHGKTILWKKYLDPSQRDYLRIAGGDYLNDAPFVDPLVYGNEASFSEIRLFGNGTVVKHFHEIQPGIIIGDPKYEARMMSIWNELNANSAPTVIEETPNSLRMTYLKGTPLAEYAPGELKLNPGAWDRFIAKLMKLHKKGYIFGEFNEFGRNVQVLDGEIYLVDFGSVRLPVSDEMQYEVETINDLRLFIQRLGVPDLAPYEPEPIEASPAPIESR